MTEEAAGAVEEPICTVETLADGLEKWIAKLEEASVALE
jgi:hypothetical protein